MGFCGDGLDQLVQEFVLRRNFANDGNIWANFVKTCQNHNFTELNKVSVVLFRLKYRLNLSETA